VKPIIVRFSLITRYSLLRAKGDVLVLLYFFLFGQRFLDNPRADSCQSLHAGVYWFRMSSPVLGFSGSRGTEKRGNEIFVTIGVNGEFFLHFGGF